jgi:hypothetical protein
MANEISISLSCSISSAGQTVQGSGNFLTSLGGGGFLGNEQTIGTTAEAIVIGDVATPAAVYVKNLDPDNFVQVDSAATMDKFPQKLMPGMSICLLPTTGVIYAKADTANCKIWAVVG